MGDVVRVSRDAQVHAGEIGCITDVSERVYFVEFLEPSIGFYFASELQRVTR